MGSPDAVSPGADITRGRNAAGLDRPWNGSQCAVLDESERGLPIARSVVRISEVIKGHAAAVSVLQLGGPMPGGTDGVLAYLGFDELVLPGDEAFFLLADRPDLGAHQPLPNTGIYFIRNGRVYAEETNYHFGSAITGQAIGDFRMLLRQALTP